MAGSSEERAIAAVGSAVAPGWIHTWGVVGRGSVPRVEESACPPHVLWFLVLWHLMMILVWAWSGVGNEAEEEGGGRAASVAVNGVAYGAGPEAEAARGAGGDSGGTLTGKEDGLESGLDEAVALDGSWDGELQWFCGKDEESPRGCWGSGPQASPGTLLGLTTSLQ